MSDLPAGAVPEPDELRFWLALWRAPGVGAATFRKLLDRFGQPREIFQCSATALSEAGLSNRTCTYLKAPDWQGADSDLSWLSLQDHHILVESSALYPPLLREIPDPPPVLFVAGNPELLSHLQLAMVGSRNPTPGGRRTAAEFAAYLAATGLAITSGLASGIDAASHRGALDSGGNTIAVMGTGPDRIYPAGHQELALEISANGALVSEFPAGTAPRAENFPKRNRIISGLSLGTLVVEAAPRSGSLITARQALEQGREVFAIPGSIHNPLARGCHAMIRQGAKLVETARDVLEELGPLALTARSEQPEPGGDEPFVPDDEYAQLLEYIGFEPASVDQLVERSGLTPEAVSSMLLILELQEFVASNPGGLYSRIRKEG